MKHPLSLGLLGTLIGVGSAVAAGAADDRHPNEMPLAAFHPTTVTYDEPGDGSLWARGATYKAGFAPDGATYIPFLGSDAPRNQPLAMRLSSARIDGRQIPLTERASVARDGDSVTLDRGAVDVRYHLSPACIEQTFIIDPVVPDGDLVVEIEMQSELERRATNAGFEWSGERGGVRYGSALVLDAEGRSLDLESRLTNAGISIRVPQDFLEEAVQPIVIDPIISTFAINAGPTGTWSGDVAYDATHDMFLYTYTFLFSANDYDIFSVPVDGDGTPRYELGMWIDVSSADWRHAAVANNNAEDNFLVVAEATYGGISQVYGRIRQLPGMAVGPMIQISANGTDECRLPSVGGDASGGSADNYLVAWAEEHDSNDRSIKRRLVNADGTLASSVTTLDGGGQNNWRPHVSRSNGSGSSGERLWNIVWAQENGGESDIRGAQVAPNGFLTTPAFYVDSTSVDHKFPAVTPPLDSASGGPRDFVVVYTAWVDGQSDLHARLFKGNDYIASYDLTELEAEAIGDEYQDQSQLWPTIAADGANIIVAYSETVQGEEGSSLYLSSFHHNGDDLFVNDAHVAVRFVPDESVAIPGLVTAHESGAEGSQLVALIWMEGGAGGDANTMGGLYQTPEGYVPLGDTYCAGMPNSTGSSATFRAYGSPDIDDNRLILDVDNLPPWSNGMFVMSSEQDSVPFGDGFLCLAAPRVRLNSSIGNAWTSGARGFEVDLTNLPQGLEFQPSDSWNFQYWYRDGGSQNFSNALEIQF